MFISAKEALVDEFVAKLPNGYETIAGEFGLKTIRRSKSRE